MNQIKANASKAYARISTLQSLLQTKQQALRQPHQNKSKLEKEILALQTRLLKSSFKTGDIKLLAKTYFEMQNPPPYTTIKMLRYIIELDHLSHPPTREIRDPSKTHIPASTDNYALLVAEIATEDSMEHLNKLLAFYVNRNDADAMQRVVVRMAQLGYEYDSYTYNLLLRYHGHYKKDLAAALDIYASMPHALRNYQTHAVMLNLAASLSLHFNYARFLALIKTHEPQNTFERDYILKAILDASCVMRDKETHQHALQQIIAANSHRLSPLYFSRSSHTTIFNDPPQYPLLQQTVDLITTPTTHTLETRIKYLLSINEIQQALELMDECAAIKESELRTPRMPILNLLFHACLSAEDLSGMNRVISCGKSIGHNVGSMQRMVARFYYARGMYTELDEWDSLHSGNTSTSNLVLKSVIERYGLFKGLDFFSSKFNARIPPSITTFNILLYYSARDVGITRKLMDQVKECNLALNEKTVKYYLGYYKQVGGLELGVLVRDFINHAFSETSDDQPDSTPADLNDQPQPTFTFMPLDLETSYKILHDCLAVLRLSQNPVFYKLILEIQGLLQERREQGGVDKRIELVGDDLVKEWKRIKSGDD